MTRTEKLMLLRMLSELAKNLNAGLDSLEEYCEDEPGSYPEFLEAARNVNALILEVAGL